MTVPWPSTANRRFRWLGSVRESITKLIKPLVTTSLLITAGTLAIRYVGLMEAAELAAYDHFIQLKPDETKDDRFLVVGITEADLQVLEEWPISDRTLSQTITSLEQHQPQTIAIDIFRDFPHEPGTQELLAQFQQNPKIISICKVSTFKDAGIHPPAGISTEQIGFADVVVDPGGILRRSLLLTGPPEPETPFPIQDQHFCNQFQQPALQSLSFKTAKRYLEAQGVKANFKDQTIIFGSTVIPKIRPHMGGYQGTDTNGYQIMLNYRSARQAVPQVNLMEVINGTVDPALIRDRIVFIGYTTPQAKDDFYTPYSVGKDDNQKMPGVVVHAQSASQLISVVLDNRPLIWEWSATIEILWIFAWAVAGGILSWYLRHPAAFATIIVVGCGGLYGLCLLIFTQGGWIPLMPPVFTFIGTAVGVVLLDRFSQSAYGQQVYRKVKNFLHLNIEIDEERLEKQVSDITETDYFRNLQDKIKALRNQPEESSEYTSENSNLSLKQTAYPWNHERDGSGALSHKLDALFPPLDNLQSENNVDSPKQSFSQQANQKENASGDNKVSYLNLENHSLETTSSNDDNLSSHKFRDFDSSANSVSEQFTHEYELDFIQQLNQKARWLKQNLVTESPQSSNHTSPPLPQQGNDLSQEHSSSAQPYYVPFVIDSDFCQQSDSSNITQKYLTDLEKQVAILQSDLTMNDSVTSTEQ